MPEVAEVRCTDDSLSLLLAPGSNPDRMAGEFQIGAVVSGGAEWGCYPRGSDEPASPITRRVLAVVSGVNQVAGPLIILQTRDCQPFEAFEYEDIDIWSTPDVGSSSRRTPGLAATGASTGGASNRLHSIDSDRQSSSSFQKSDEILLVDNEENFVSLEYGIHTQFSFRFKIHASTSSLGPTLHEFESWIDEHFVISVLAKARATTVYSQDYRRVLNSSLPLFKQPLSIGGVSTEIGLFGRVAMRMEVGLESQFSGELGTVVSRQAKYGCQWNPDTSSMIVINEGGAVSSNKTFVLEGKVVAVVNPVIDFAVALRLGAGLSWLGRLEFELSSGLKAGLKGRVRYGLGNLILPSSVSTSGLYVINEDDCQVKHEAQV